MTGTAVAHLRVLEGGSGFDGRFAGLVRDVAGLADLPPLVSGRPAGGAPRQQAVLAFAAATPEPVLVLPAAPDDLRMGAEAADPRLQRALVPIDRSAEEQPVLRWWVERAQAAGVAVEQVHVLDATTRPVMWDGPGHHAEAWHAGLRRRHQIGDAPLRVRSGDPAAGIGSMTHGFDLVIVCWKGNPASSRALVVRRVLAAVPKPLLLVRGIPGRPPGSRLTRGAEGLSPLGGPDGRR